MGSISDGHCALSLKYAENIVQCRSEAIFTCMHVQAKIMPRNVLLLNLAKVVILAVVQSRNWDGLLV